MAQYNEYHFVPSATNKGVTFCGWSALKSVSEISERAADLLYISDGV